MAKLAIVNFEKLIKSARDSTIMYAASSPFVSKGRSHAAAIKAGLDTIKTGLEFDFVHEDQFDINSVQDTSSRRPKVMEELSLDKDPAAEKNVIVVVNWLINFVNKIMEKVNQHAKLIKFNQKATEDKADQKEVADLQTKYDNLDKECDEVRQRGMKGNIIISSPNLQGKHSLIKHQKIKDPTSGAERLEYDHEMCIRMIKLKTGVDVPVHDVVAYHTLTKRGSESSYIVRIVNMRSGSAWSVLAAGMLTGRNNVTKSNFTQDNVFLNFQLTKKKNGLLSLVRKAKKDKKISKYGVDQNGKVTLKVKATSRWEEVTSSSDLDMAITNSLEHTNHK